MLHHFCGDDERYEETFHAKSEEEGVCTFSYWLVKIHTKIKHKEYTLLFLLFLFLLTVSIEKIHTY